MFATIIIGIIGSFSILGLIDMIIGGKMGLSTYFFNAISNIGSLFLTLAGVYCLGVTVINMYAESIASALSFLPFDPSLIFGAIIAIDVGALPIARGLAATPVLADFTGAIVASCVGATISFQIPLYLSMIEKKDIPLFMRGILYGFLTLPLSLIPTALYMKIPVADLAINILPLVILSIVLLVSYLKIPEGIIKFLGALGQLIKTINYILTAYVMLGIFIPAISIVEMETIYVMLYLTVRMGLIAGGGIVLAKVLTRFLKKPFEFVGRLTGTNMETAMSMLLNCFQTVAFLPLFPTLNRRGKIMMSALSVSAAYIFGGQFAYVNSECSDSTMNAFLLNKAIAFVVCVVLVMILEKEDTKVSKN